MLDLLSSNRQFPTVTALAGHETPPFNATVIDWEELVNRNANRLEFIDRLAALFLKRHGEDGGKLRQMSVNHDINGIEQLAHELKGSAGNILAVEVQT